MKPHFNNISGTYTVVLPEIWHQNVTVSQIAILFILNLFSFYLQNILLAVFPNICLLILYLIFNNIVIFKGSNDEKLTKLKFAQYPTYSDFMSEFHSNYQNMNFPIPGQLISISPYHFKDPNSLNLGSNSNSDSFNCKKTNYTLNPLITTASSTITTTSTNYVKPYVIASTVTTSTSSSCSPVSSVASVTPESFKPVASCIPDFAISTFGSTNLISPAVLPNVITSNTNSVCSSVPVSTSESITCNFPKVSEKLSQNLISQPSVLTSSNDNDPKTFEIFTKQNHQNVQSERVEFKEVHCNENIILEKLSELQSHILNSSDISKLSVTEIKSMQELLPKFDGDLKYYKLFKEQFQLMTEHHNISSKDKAFLLYSCLGEKVCLNLGPQTLNNSISLELLWQNLDQEYCLPQNSQLYYSNALFSMDSWPVCKDVDDLNQLYKFILENHRGLEREGCHESQLIYGMKILSLLEGDLSYNVAKILSDSCSTQILPKILRVLKQEIRMLEINKIAQATTNGIPVQFEKNNSSSISSQKYADQNFKRSKNHDQCLVSEVQRDSLGNLCVFCQSKNHFSNYCTYYSRPSEFKYSLFKDFRCYNCLERGHRSFNCSKPKVCKLCTDARPHNPVLCHKNSNNRI